VRAAEDSADPVNRVSVKATGRQNILGELVEAGDVMELEHGHLIDAESYRLRVEALAGQREPFGSREAARMLGCSHTRTKAILAKMTSDGYLERDDGLSRASADPGGTGE
jgi:hypothetical protein